MQRIMDLGEVPILYDILLHIATLLVIAAYFRRRIVTLAAGVLRAIGGSRSSDDMAELKLFGIIMAGTVCTAVIGLLVRSAEIFRYEDVVYSLFIATALILILVSFVRPKHTTDRPRLLQGLIVGIAQGIGTLPGISRSGITISAALWSGISKERAGELSFLFFIPAVLGALLLELLDGFGTMTVSAPAVAAGMLAAIVTGFISLKLLMALVSSSRLYLFSFYLIPLGIVGLGFL